MNFPLTLSVGGWQLSVHLLCELLAFFLGFRYFLYLRGRQADPIDDANRVWILIGAAAGALFGSRLIGSLEDPQAFFSGEHGIWYYYTSKTIVGGLLGGLAGVEWTKKTIGEQRSSGDLFTYPLIFGLMIGRIGCWSAGVFEPTYGLPSSLPWAMDLGDGILRHPTALYEIVFLGMLAAALGALERRWNLQEGLRFQLFMIAYLCFRWGLELLKPGFRFSFGLTTIQLSCVAGLLYYSRTIWRLFFHFSTLSKPLYAQE